MESLLLQLNKLILGILLISTSVQADISPQRKVLFDAGYYAPYNEEYIKRHRSPEIYIIESNILNDIKITEEDPASLATWTLFFLAQAGDIWSTKRALAYDCVYEMNPLLPRVPEVHEMILLKTFIFGNLLPEIDRRGLITDEVLMPTTIITSIVVHNNLKVYDRAKRNCSKR